MNSCTQMRRMLITHSSLNMATGETTEGRKEWVTRPCNVPLFDARSKALGKCTGCEGGWTHPHNYAVEEVRSAEPEPVDHQAARWDHARDLRKHEA